MADTEEAKLDRSTDDERGHEQPPTSVISVKRKLGEALSPESIQASKEVSGKTTIGTPSYKKRHLLSYKKKGSRKVPRPRIAKQVSSIRAKIADNSTAAQRDDDDNDYDSTDELPLSGLVRKEAKGDDRDYITDPDSDPDRDPDPNINKPQTRSGTTGWKKSGPTTRGKRVLNMKPSQDLILNALTAIQHDIATMKLDGNKRDHALGNMGDSIKRLSDDTMTKAEMDETFGTMENSVRKLTNTSITKAELDDTLITLATRIGGAMDEQKTVLNQHSLQIGNQGKVLMENMTTLEVHDARLTSLEKDITDDLTHFKKRLEGLEYRIEKIHPPPPLLPETRTQGPRPLYADVVTHGNRVLTQQPIVGKPNISAQPSENKCIVIEGLTEYPMENLQEMVFDLLDSIGIRMMECDYNTVERLGRWKPQKQWPRPIKLELITMHKKNKIIASGDFLKETEDYFKVRIQPDEPKSIRVGRAMLRQAANKARQEGKRVWQTKDTVEIDGVKYNTTTIKKNIDNSETDRSGVNTHATTAARGNRPGTSSQPVGVATKNGNLKYAENLCTLDTPYGIAFYTIQSRFSNFYPSDIWFNGRNYISVEQGYQAEKAISAEDVISLTAILNAKTPAEAKGIGYNIKTGTKWLHNKRDIMRKLLYAKFSQHKDLGDYLCSTRGKQLIEGSTDEYWGAGVQLHSKEMKDGVWHGRNELGRLLMSVRDELLQEREAQVSASMMETEVPPSPENVPENAPKPDVNLINLDMDTTKNMGRNTVEMGNEKGAPKRHIPTNEEKGNLTSERNKSAPPPPLIFHPSAIPAEACENGAAATPTTTTSTPAIHTPTNPPPPTLAAPADTPAAQNAHSATTKTLLGTTRPDNATQENAHQRPTPQVRTATLDHTVDRNTPPRPLSSCTQGTPAITTI